MSTNYSPAFISLDSISQYLLDPKRLSTTATELGFMWTQGESLLTFAISASFAQEAAQRGNVACVLVDESVDLEGVDRASDVFVRVRDARLNFFRLHNSLRSKMAYQPSVISPSAQISTSAIIDSVGVEIGEGVIIETGVTIQIGRAHV